MEIDETRSARRRKLKSENGFGPVSEMTSYILSESLPEFAAELADSLNRQGRPDLAAQAAIAPLIERCRCGDSFCATLYTAPKPDGPYGPGHENLQVDVNDGFIILDLVNGMIVCVEALYRPDVRKALLELFP